MRNRSAKVRLEWIGAILVVLLLLAGCGKEADNGKETLPASPASSASSATGTSAPSPEVGASAASSPEPAAVTDSTGTSLTLPAKVERIACLTEICVDSLAELGLEPVAIMPDSLAFEPEFYGDKASAFGQIGGGFMEPSLEDIAKSKPQLVVGLLGTHDQLRDGLKSIAPLYIADLKTYQDSIAFLELIGKLTGKEKEAAAAKQRLLDKLADYKAKSPKDKSALIIYGADVNFGIDTAGSLVGSMLAEVTSYPWPAPAAQGGHQEGGMAYSLEKVLETDPDQLFIETFAFAPDAPSLSKQFAANPLWSKLKAVKENHVAEVRTAIWANGRGTRSLGIILDEAMRTLYPDTFKDSAQ